MFRRISVLTFLVFLCLCCNERLVAQSYDVVSMGTIVDHFAPEASDISNTGVVVGTIRLNNSNERHAFIYDEVGGMRLLPGTGDSYANGISDDGLHIIGRIQGNNSLPAGRWDWNGTDYQRTDLGTAQRTTAGIAINNSMQAVGNSFFSNVRGFAHDGTSYVSTTLGTSANDINEFGMIVGRIGTVAFMTTMNDLSPQSIGTLGGSSSEALGVNDLSQIVGNASTSGNETHAFLYSGGTMIDLGTLGGDLSSANEINVHSQIVGFSRIDLNTSDTRAFIWQNGTMTDLNTLIDPGSGWVLERATSINDLGQIVGVGTFNGMQNQVFLLNAIPEPEPWIFIGILVLGYIVCRRVKPSTSFQVACSLANDRRFSVASHAHNQTQFGQLIEGANRESHRLTEFHFAT